MKKYFIEELLQESIPDFELGDMDSGDSSSKIESVAHDAPYLTLEASDGMNTQEFSARVRINLITGKVVEADYYHGDGLEVSIASRGTACYNPEKGDILTVAEAKSLHDAYLRWGQRCVEDSEGDSDGEVYQNEFTDEKVDVEYDELPTVGDLDDAQDWYESLDYEAKLQVLGLEEYSGECFEGGLEFEDHEEKIVKAWKTQVKDWFDDQASQDQSDITGGDYSNKEFLDGVPEGFDYDEYWEEIVEAFKNRSKEEVSESKSSGSKFVDADPYSALLRNELKDLIHRAMDQDHNDGARLRKANKTIFAKFANGTLYTSINGQYKDYEFFEGVDRVNVENKVEEVADRLLQTLYPLVKEVLA